MTQCFCLKAHSYVSDTLEGHLEPILARPKSNGPISSRKRVNRRSEFDFLTRGCSCPNDSVMAAKNQNLLFWGKGPDINPIENPWSILKVWCDSLHSAPRS
ncbi:unnamed protein product [Lepeophtheirus salmonis]|uniref:(salmon louse) hypothetical protein n=1 Tax=Lepeophtheirus salmonis TaxID=72036 RepID=A0A7R8CLE5_LEPSM|nr:unnamed protein product [Lepeophtheirus salmonis]CAF2858172.1 unnamed protein product [Lepeophtheirus salmonis]